MNLHSAMAFNLDDDDDDEFPREPVLQLRRPPASFMRPQTASQPQSALQPSTASQSQSALQPSTSYQPRRPIQSQVKHPQTASQPRWRPRSWTGIPQLEDIQEIRSQESLEIR